MIAKITELERTVRARKQREKVLKGLVKIYERLIYFIIEIERENNNH